MRWPSILRTSMAVRNSAVVGVSINQGELSHVPASVQETWTGLFSWQPVNHFFPVALCGKRTR